MKQKTFLVALILASITSILTLSSFFKQPQTPANTSYDNDNVQYQSTNKQSKSIGNISYSAAFENDYFTPQNRQGNYYVEVHTDKYLREDQGRTPLNISIVIDRSGSMAGSKLQNAKQAASYIVDQLSSNDYLSLVIYDGSVDVLQYTTAVINKQTIKNKIESITDRGGTNLTGGALKGYEQVKKEYKSGYINRVLLLSDGQANEGITNPKEIERIVSNQSRENGITISTFGLGNDFNEDLMTSMAEHGSGNYYFISNPENIASIFRKELNGLMEVSAQNATVQITLPDNVNVDAVYGCKHVQVGRLLTVQLHDIFANETRGVLVRYTITKGNNMPVQFATSLSYTNGEEGKVERIYLQNKSEFTNNYSVYNESFNEWVSAQVALYVSNEKLELAMKEVDKGNYKEAKKMVKDNNAYISSKAELIKKSPELQRAQISNASYDEKIQAVEDMPADQVKFIQKESKNENYLIRSKR
jgi:Ca-activated chloride channel family protein